MSGWDKDDDNEFLAGVMAVLSGTGDQAGSSKMRQHAGRGASKAAKAAPKKRERKKPEASIDTSGAFSFEALGKRPRADADSLGSSPEPSFRGGGFGGFGEDDGNDFEGFASTIQQDLEREMTKKKKAKHASLQAHQKKCNEMIKAESNFYDREIDMLQGKEKKENEVFFEQGLMLLQELEKVHRHWCKTEASLKKSWEGNIAEEISLYAATKEKAALIYAKAEPLAQNIRSRSKALNAEKKKRGEELEKKLEEKARLAEQVVSKIQRMAM